MAALPGTPGCLPCGRQVTPCRRAAMPSLTMQDTLGLTLWA